MRAVLRSDNIRDMYEQSSREELRHLLSAGVLKDKLAKSGLVLLAYELLKKSLIERPKGFYSTNGTSPDREYVEQVLSGDPNPLIATCMWFQKLGAITEEDLEAIRKLRDHRNYIAHQSVNVLLDGSVQIELTIVLDVLRLLSEVDQWWISEIEIPSDSNFDGKEVQPWEIRSASMDLLYYLITLVHNENHYTGATGVEKPN